MYFKTAFEFVPKKIRFAFSPASPFIYFTNLIPPAVNTNCSQGSFGLDDAFSFKGASLFFPIKNDIFTKFSSIIL